MPADRRTMTAAEIRTVLHDPAWVDPQPLSEAEVADLVRLVDVAEGRVPLAGVTQAELDRAVEMIVRWAGD